MSFVRWSMILLFATADSNTPSPPPPLLPLLLSADDMIGFVAAVEEDLATCLRDGTIPPPSLVDAISVAKIRAISVSIERAHALRLEVGSYALMHKTGFELIDMFLCCKFAEGDSRILQMKLMRDRLKMLKKGGVPAAIMACFGKDSKEAMKALSLAQKMAPAGRDLAKMDKVMTENWQDIYELAELVEERIMRDYARRPLIEGKVVERIWATDTSFDKEWIKKL